MTKYVISGYIGFDNFGDEAIAGVIINHLKEQNPEKITVISANPEKTSRLYGVNSCGMLKFLGPILASDVLISGGGSLLQDITSLRSLIYYLMVIMTAILFGKKVIVVAQGFSKFRTQRGRVLTKFVLKKCHKVTVRDKQSQDYLKTLGIESALMTDPVFGMDIPQISEHKGVGVQLRNCRGLGNEFLIPLAEEIAEKFKGQEIKLFSFQDNIDLPIIDKFAEFLTSNGAIVKIYKNLSVTEVIHEVSRLEYFIGMRFHSCLISTKSGVKTLGINYDTKVANLANNVGFPIINMYGCEVKNGIENLLNQNPGSYSIPEFIFELAL
jgi:polysaccharide pyruvyl transferase CsaB